MQQQHTNNQLNNVLQNLMNAKRQGQNPQQLMNSILQQNPQARQTLVQLKNMAQGQSPREFFMKLARQNGADQQALDILSQFFTENTNP